MSTFECFTGKRDGTLWYYRARVAAIETLDVPSGLRREFRAGAAKQRSPYRPSSLACTASRIATKG